MEKITSAANPAVKRLKALSDAKNRKKSGEFLVEGEVMIDEALKSGLKPVEALFESETPLCQRLMEGGALVRLATREVIVSACDTKTPQGCCAAFKLPENERLPENARRLIALDGVQDPGNLGTILRTADAAGFDGIILSEICADMYSPKVQRAAMGSGFRVPAVRTDIKAALIARHAEGFKIVVSALDGKDLYSSKSEARGDKFILVIGNEAAGVSQEIQGLSDIKLKIPMRGRAESLNAAVAAGILMYELTRPK